jgi:hypothetical protein
MTDTKRPTPTTGWEWQGALPPHGPPMENQGDPAEWCKFVDTLFQIICENYDQADMSVLALRGKLQNIEMEIDRLLAISRKWGDLLPFSSRRSG